MPNIVSRFFICAMVLLAGVLAAEVVPDSEIATIHSKFEILLKEVPDQHFYPAKTIGTLLEKYSDDELELIYQDLIEIREKTFAHVLKQRDYLVTAGGPSCGKSILLENKLEGKIPPPDALIVEIQRAYIDPDRTCLLRMEHTYKNDISKGKRDPQKAYNHWREASNFLSNYYLAIALKEGCAIAHGSTMATPFAKNALLAIRHHYGYLTTIIHLSCEEETRKESERIRQARGVVQCTEKDFQEKQSLFFTLLEDYIKSVKVVLFCYRYEMESTLWAAKVEHSQLSILDDGALAAIRNLHDSAIEEGFWDKTMVKLK